MKTSAILLCIAALTAAWQSEPTAPSAAESRPSTAVASAVSYTMINLGSLGSATEPAATNNAGQVVGNSFVKNGAEGS